MPTSRRLQLAAEAGGGLGILVLLPEALAQPSAARTHSQISAASGIGTKHYHLGRAAWRLQLVKAIGERPAEWDLFRDEDDQVLLSRDAEPEDYRQGQVGQVPRGLRRELPLAHRQGGCSAEQRRGVLRQAVDAQRLELDLAVEADDAGRRRGRLCPPDIWA
jgi:hypothetical protein